MVKKNNKKSINNNFIDRFLNYKIVKHYEIKKENISPEQENELLKWFDLYGFRSSQDWFKQLSIWIMLNVFNFIERREKLEILGKQKLNLETAIIKYGEIEGKKIYQNLYNFNNSNRKNKVEYWLKKGYSLKEAKELISKNQSIIAKKSVIKKNAMKGVKAYSPRCNEYWMNKGYSLVESIDKVSKYQSRGKEWFVEKYEEDGLKKYNQSRIKRINTWKNKTIDDLYEHAIKTLPKKFNENGQEIKAIKLFIDQNNISDDCCSYGSPENQYYQYIDNIGFRRYDLAVFEDSSKKKLKIIFEFHGLGHINFSEFDESLKNNIISINGKELSFLGTYGDVYNNDIIKKTHIISKYPNTIYCVMWPDDLKNKKGKIDDLRTN